jgi:adenylate kinase family enzyme
MGVEAQMIRIVVVGNSGSGKSTLATRLAQGGLAHLDLDTLAWLPEMPPKRQSLEKSGGQIDAHKYASREAQDANLEMLLGWIRDYETRDDVCSRALHTRLFDGFSGVKHHLRSRDEIGSFRI